MSTASTVVKIHLEKGEMAKGHGFHQALNVAKKSAKFNIRKLHSKTITAYQISYSSRE